jgi:hypothetical protein
MSDEDFKVDADAMATDLTSTTTIFRYL